MDQYLKYFSSLHTNKTKGQVAPHKAILLLSVIDLIEAGVITSNKIELSKSIQQQFLINWSRNVFTDVFQPKVATPFWHMQYEPFWRLIPYEEYEAAIPLLKQTNVCSVGAINRYFKYAEIDNRLFRLIAEEPTARREFRIILNERYLKPVQPVNRG